MADFNKNVIFNSFIKGQFNYRPLIWMISTKVEKHKINRLREKVLRELLHDGTLLYEETINNTLSKSNNTTIRVKKYSKIDD